MLAMPVPVTEMAITYFTVFTAVRVQCQTVALLDTSYITVAMHYMYSVLCLQWSLRGPLQCKL